MLWSCQYTGKSGLTYQEAHDSERAIRKQGHSLPEPIQRAALTLVHHTQRGRLANLCDEVFSYLKDHYQEGEEVDVHYLSSKKRGIITRVIPPSEGSSPSGKTQSSPNKTGKSGKLLSPKSRKHSNSGDKLHSPTSKDRNSPSDGTPRKERCDSSSSSDSQPLSSHAKKYNANNVFAKSPTGKSPRKSLDEESHSKPKSRKQSVESCGEKTASKSRKHSSDGKGTPSKQNSDKIAKKPSTPSSRKSNDDKIVSPKSKSSCDVIAVESPKTSKSPSTSKTKSFEGEIVIIDDDDDNDNDDNKKSSKKPSPKLTSPKEKPVYNWPSAALYHYEIRIHSDKKDKGSKKKEKKQEVVIVQASLVSRRKGVFTRDKVKMFLKISCERSTPHSEEGVYIVQRAYRQKFDLGEPDIPLKLASPPKNKKHRKRSLTHGDQEGEGGPAKKKRKKKNKEDESKNEGEGTKKKKEKKEKDGKSKDDKKMKLPPGEWRRIMEEEKEKRKKQMEEEKERKKLEREREKAENKVKREEERAVKKIERDKEREKQREEKRLEAIRLKEWNKPREDLELDDLKDLPMTTPVAMKLSSELFGDMMMVLEFLNVFGNLFDIKDEFPSGLSFAMLEEALTEHDAEGVYYDLLLFLLGAILRTHLEEEEDEGLDGTHEHEPLREVDDDGDEKSQATVSASATMAAAWPMQYQGKPLHELIMDPFTSSELLRLHLLSSGARIGCGEPSYRWQRRGGFTYSDDAGVEFRHAEPQLLKSLVTCNIYDMGAEDKLKVLVALCTQLITYATARDYVEEGFDQCRKVRREWQEDQWADQRKEKEEAAARYRRKQEERQRQKEELEKRKKEKDQEKIDGAKGEPSAKPEDAAKNGSEQNEEDQVKKGGKKTAKKKDENESTSQASETKESPMVNGNKPTEDKESEASQVPVLTKEEEEDLAQQRREERKRKDQEFLNQLAKAVARSAIQPLGRDRVFRRYWAFRSLRGLFVEDDDPDQHLLLEPESESESEDNEEESGDEQKEDGKENENSTLDPSNSADTKKEEKHLVNGHTKGRNTAKNENFERKVLNMFKAYQLSKETCGDDDWCESYKKRPVVKWSYFAAKEDIDKLLDSLNPRGFRERLLKDAVQQEYKHLTIAVEKCPLKADIQAQKKDSKPKGRRGGRNQPTVDKSRYKTMEEFLEANLRDQILDLEDRIWQGNLGSIRNADREAWRAKVENGIYGDVSKTEALGGEECKPNGVSDVKENGDAELMEVDTSVEDEGKASVDSSVEAVTVKKEEPMECDEEKQPVVNGVKEEIKQEGHTVDSKEVTKMKDKPDEAPFTAIPSHLQLDSQPSSPGEGGTRCSTPTLSLVVGSVAVNPAVKELALELLKVEQGIEKKYLNPPLGEDEETKRQKQKEAAAAAVSEFNEMMKAAEKQKKKDKRKKETATDGEEPKENEEKEGEGEEKEDKDDSSSSSSDDEPVKHKTCLERWEESLLVCTNLSQVFVHLNTLDQSIAWSKSVLNARCRLCKRKGDAEHMLLCDACDRGHHMYCLKPPIKEIPEGQWFCADCRPKETRRSERRRKPEAKEEDEEEDERKSAEEEEESEEEEASEEEEDDDSESDSEEEESEPSDGSESSEHGDQCALCTEGGELLCCDTCPLAYHLSCAYPPLRRIPRGNWACQVCTGADDERPRSTRVKKATIEAAQKSLQRSIKVVKKKPTRSTSRPNSRQTKKAPSRSRKRQLSSSPSPPPRTRKTGTKADKTSTKRRRVSSSSRSVSSRSPSPAPRSSRREGIKIAARGGRGRSSIDSSRSSSPVLRSEPSKKPAGRKNPKLAAKLVLCQKLLNEIMKHEDAWPFLEPVDVAENPDYLEFVQRPVDLGTIKKNLTAKAYDSVEDFAADVRQVFINCSEYCRPRGKEARAGVRLSAFFETQYSDMGLDATETRETRSRRS
ncbi:hypothetical protein ACROYT_G040281 [Oculina patagonica]